NARHGVREQKPAEMIARIEEYLPLSQGQIDRLAHAISERVADVTEQMQGVAGRFTGRAPKKQANYRAWWIAGIGLGFITAGAAAYFFTRRRMSQQTAQELVALPASGNNGQGASQHRLRAVVSNIMHRESSRVRVAGEEVTGASRTATLTSHEIGDITQAQFVGNVRTMVYHPLESEHLPSEENRIYFRSEEDAEMSGYHKAEGE
ncbi:MAG TPA: hypothetical protein VKB76_09950, partial [Ktedonobacterales bacterium]|nr:hypothetical protein [Ktedonobacterales bacterium]